MVKNAVKTIKSRTKLKTFKSRTLDAIDLKILQLLQDNARISYVDLALKVGLSTTPF